MGNSRKASLGSVTGRDEFIIGEAFATALVALEQLPEALQPTRNIGDMKMLLNSLYPPPKVVRQANCHASFFLAPNYCARMDFV